MEQEAVVTTVRCACPALPLAAFIGGRPLAFTAHCQWR